MNSMHLQNWTPQGGIKQQTTARDKCIHLAPVTLVVAPTKKIGCAKECVIRICMDMLFIVFHCFAPKHSHLGHSWSREEKHQTATLSQPQPLGHLHLSWPNFQPYGVLRFIIVFHVFFASKLQLLGIYHGIPAVSYPTHHIHRTGTTGSAVGIRRSVREP